MSNFRCWFLLVNLSVSRESVLDNYRLDLLVIDHAMKENIIGLVGVSFKFDQASDNIPYNLAISPCSEIHGPICTKNNAKFSIELPTS